MQIWDGLGEQAAACSPFGKTLSALRPTLSGYDCQPSRVVFPVFAKQPVEFSVNTFGEVKHLYDDELRSLFGAPKGGNVIHVAQAGEEPTVFRLFVPERDTSLERYTTALKRAAHQACGEERLIPWIERGTYQFAVLLPNEGRVGKLTELIREEEFPDIRFYLGVAPSLRDLPLFISPEKDGEQ
jgi:hypothetical protein